MAMPSTLCRTLLDNGCPGTVLYCHLLDEYGVETEYNITNVRPYSKSEADEDMLNDEHIT